MLANGAAACVALILTMYAYRYIGLESSFIIPIHIGTVTALLFTGYAIGYVHECIPHCSGSVLRSLLRFVGMMVLLMAPVFYLFMLPENLIEWFFMLDVMGSVVIVPAAVTVLLMYRFARTDPGNVPGGVCPL